MPASEVFGKYKHKQLHSGSKSGPLVKSRPQMLAIYESEKKNEDATGSADEREPKKRTKPQRRRTK